MMYLKTAVERMEAAQKEVLEAKNEISIKDVWKFVKQKRSVKSYIYQSKKEVNEQFGKKVNQNGVEMEES